MKYDSLVVYTKGPDVACARIPCTMLQAISKVHRNIGKQDAFGSICIDRSLLLAIQIGAGSERQ